jgi:hypothetical protein
MTRKAMAPIATILLVAFANPSEARKLHFYHSDHHYRPLDGNGNAATAIVRSGKTGATARVSNSYAAAFQGYINELEAQGASIRFMGGYRHGRCASYSLHPCGKALDICQVSRGRVDARCHLPRPQAMAAIAERHGLFEGGRWCQSDYGHAQVGLTATACGSNRYAYARRHHRSSRLANINK